MIHAQCVVFQYISEVPSKSLPMDELPGFMNVTKNSPIGFETEYNVCFTFFIQHLDLLWNIVSK